MRWIAGLCLALVAACAAAKTVEECAAEVGESVPEDDRRSMIARCTLGMSLVEEKPAPPPAIVWPTPSTAALVSFAKANVGKYRQELPRSSLQVGEVYSTRAKLDAVMLTTYDPEAEKVSIGGFSAQPRHFKILSACRNTGSFVGQNSFGTKARVALESCEETKLQLPTLARVSLSGDFKAASADYRRLKQRGLDVEVLFRLATDFSGTVADRIDDVDSATVQSPVETRTRSWTIYGEVQAVRLLVPGREPVLLFRK